MKIKILILTFLVSAFSWGQILIPNATPVTQNFDGMGSSSAATLPTGFVINSTANYSTGLTATTVAAGTSGTGALTSGSGGGCYNYGNGVTAASTDRALGFLNSGGYTSPRSIIVAIQNTGSSVITDLSINFDYEKYRTGTRAFNWTFFHGSTATAVPTSATSGDQAYAADGANAVVNPPTTISKTVTLTGLSIPVSGLYYLCWTFTGVGGSTNGQGIGIDNFSVTATFTVAASPVITSALSTSGVVGSPFSYTITATNSPTSYTCGALPAGLSLDGTTGIISGTPTAISSASVTISAINGSGTGSATLVFNIVLPSPPVVTGTSISGTVGTGISYPISATNYPTSYALASGTLPAGLSLDTTTGIISGTPTAASAASVTVTATNSGGTSSPATINFSIISSACVVQGFAGGTTPPSGWIFTGISSTYTVVGNYGAASPSVSMSSSPSNSVITTEVLPTGNGASQLSFWFKGQGINTGSTSKLQVDGFDGTSWNNIDIISSAVLIASSGTAVNKVYNSGSTPALNSGFVRFRLTYLKGTGNLAVDDVAVNCTSIAVNLPVVTGSSEIATVGSAYSYYVSATNFPTSYAYTGSLPAGLTFNTATGQISGAATTVGSYSISVTATNSGGTSAPATISFTVSTYVAGCYTVNFEDGSSKSAYVSDVVTLNGKVWSLSEALTGGTNTVSDYGTGNLCIRMRSNNYANATMIQDKANGISTISFDYRKYTAGTYVNQVFNVEYSKDSGNSWIYIGSVSPTTTTSATYTSPTINQSGPIRVRIIFASGTEDNNVRINIDNLSVCDYVGATKDIEVFGNATSIFNNSVTVSENNNTNFNPAFFVGDAPIVKTFVITNNGTGTLNLSGLSLSSTTYYTITSALSSTSLSPGQSATFSITFNSILTGLKTATVTITSDDPLDGTYNFLISTKVYNYTRCTLLPPAIIAQNDFDSNIAYTYTVGGTNTNNVVAGGTNYGDNRTTKTSMFTGTKSFQSSSVLNTLTFAAVDTRNYQNLELSFNLGAYASATGDGMETSDYMLVSMSTDGGVTFYDQLKMTGNNNSIFDINNSLTANSVAYKANSTNPSRIGTLNNSTNTSASSFKITKLPNAASLIIKITFLSNLASEVWAIDNILVKGQLPLTTTWDGATWSAGPPTSSTKSIINGYYDTTTNGGSIQTCECQVVSGNTLNISAGDYIEIQSNMTNDGTVNIPNNGSLVQVNDDAVNTNSGFTTVTRRASSFKQFDYTYWSTPVDTSTISSVFSAWRTDYSFDFLTANFSDTLTINNLGVVTAAVPDSFDDYAPWAWHNYTGAMTIGQGYAIMGPTNISFPATNVTVSFVGKQNNGIVNVPIYLSGNSANANDDFNLIGNPYPSSIFADTFINLNPNISGSLYFWTHVGAISTSNPGPNNYNFISDDYAVYNLAGGTGTRGSLTGSSIPTGYIASGQGFFVEAVTAGNAFFNNSMRGKSYINNNFYKHSITTNTQVDASRSRLWLNFENPDGMFSQQLIAYDANSTLGYDRGYDAIVNASKNYVSFYSLLNSEAYKIQSRSSFDQNDIVPLGFFTGTTGNYTISIDSLEGVFDNQGVYLQDNLLNIVHDLKQGSYSFDSNYGTFNDRFVLRYTNNSLTNNNFDGVDNNVVVATPKNNQISIKSAIEKMTDVTVYDLLGREIIKKSNVNENSIILDNVAAKNQVLIVKIKLESGQIVSRKISI